MKRLLSGSSLAMLILAITTLLTGCLKDTYRHVYTIYTPVFKTLSQERNLIGNLPPTALQNTGKIYVKDNWIFINEKDKGIHVIDNSDPLHPKNAAFWNIPGNHDLAIQGNTLYADLFCDIAAINISDPTHIVAEKFLTKVDPSRLYNYTLSTNPDSILVVTGWIKKDTTVNHDAILIYPAISTPGSAYYSLAAAPAAAANTTGTGGSEQRFTIVNGYLYALGSYLLNVIDIAQPDNPSMANSITVSDPETIYPFQNKLVIGSQNGMSVYDLTNAASPQPLEWVGHWCMNDPAIADGNYIYVTLDATTRCDNISASYDQLQIYDATDFSNMTLMKTYTLRSPQGLCKNGNLLFVCDGDDGFQIFDVTDVDNLRTLYHITGMNEQDVIAENGKALIIAKGALIEYDYSDIGHLKRLGTISTVE
jgi:hypothetical protein